MLRMTTLESRFSTWFRWSERERFEPLSCPGIYAIALSHSSLGGKPFTWRREIVCIGMSNAKHGPKGRLRQFHSTISHVRSQHGPALRFLHAYPDFSKLDNQLYVAVLHFDCSPKRALSNDLRMMGEVVRAEYLCLADYLDKFHCLPRFNDKKNNPKAVW